MKNLVRSLCFLFVAFLLSTNAQSASITGTVKNEYGQGLDSIGVVFDLKVEDPDTHEITWERQPISYSYGGGLFEGSELPPGFYRIAFFDIVDPIEYFAEYWQDSETFNAATDVEITDGENDPIDAVLSRIQFKGTVTGPEGELLQGITVRAYTFDSVTSEWIVSGEASTNGDGEYALGRLPVQPPSHVILEFLDPSGSYAGEFFENAASIGLATEIELDFSPLQIDAALESLAEPIAPQIVDIRPGGNPGSFILVFVGQPGIQYQVEKSLTLGGWGNYGDPFPFEPVGDTMEISVEQDGSKTFWRIKEVSLLQN